MFQESILVTNNKSKSYSTKVKTISCEQNEL